MAKTPLEKQIEKARKEAQKYDRQEAVRQRAAMIISAQPIISGFRIIDEAAETVLKCLIEHCTDQESGHISYNVEIFPQALARSIDLEIEKLVQYGMVTSCMPWPNGGMLNLLPCAFSYFDRKIAIQEQSISEEKKVNPIIFISHRSTDKLIADMLVDFFSGTGIPRNTVFCSSLPGNDINEKISREIKAALKKSVINIVILSQDYYQSAYCLNEAGILWYQEDVPVIPIALPEIDSNKMYGFLNDEYKIRRLDCDTDISYIYDKVCEAVSESQSKVSIVIYETQKLKDRYSKFLKDREEPTSVNSTDTLSDITTDDERIVLYYILENNIRRVTKNAVVDWLHKSEVYNVNIDNAFDLLASIGGTNTNDTLEIGIEVFRKYSLNAVSLLPGLKSCLENHVRLAADTFRGLWDSSVLDSTTGLFIAYIMEEKISSFGDRWMAEGQIENIKKWESKNSLDSMLSDNYGGCLEQFKQHHLVYESSWTSYGNPREYTLCPSLQNLLFNHSEEYADDLQRIKDEHYSNLPF